ncbi:MAG: hypothetical protein JSS91_08405 [Bacteroidetes bacterium]|nr:hypothetical protein [Bacteroidota bacterium]
MDHKKEKTPLIAKVLPLLILAFVFIAGCRNNFDNLNGRVFLYKDSVYEFTAGFDKDTLFYIMKDARRPFFHKTTFKKKKVDDSTFIITVKDKPKFWDKDTWEIVVTDDKGFRSKESGNYYNLYSDSLIVKKAPEFQ